MSVESVLERSTAKLDRRTKVWTGHLLNQAAQRIRAATAEAVAPLGLTPPGIRLLEALEAAGEPPTQVRLGQAIAMDRTTVTHMVDRVEALGVVRRKPDPADRRSHLIELTDTGATVLAKARAAARAVEADFLAPLSAREREQFNALLLKLHQPQPCPEETSR